MYGKLPTSLGIQNVECKEMMFYQYLPIKLSGTHPMQIEHRLRVFCDMIGQCCCDYIGEYGLDNYVNSNVYLTVKYMFQQKGCSFNREGWHSDGFLTDDINYIWSDKFGTVFNDTDFKLTLDHNKSLSEMEWQYDNRKNIIYSDGELLRLDQYSIHKVAPITENGMRTFFKLSISKDKYNLVGNSHNYLLDYDWVMKEREVERNHPCK